MTKVLGYLILVVLLAIIVLTGTVLYQHKVRLEALEGDCAARTQMMRSVADSFRANRLDYELYWTCPGYWFCIVGTSEVATLEVK